MIKDPSILMVPVNLYQMYKLTHFILVPYRFAHDEALVPAAQYTKENEHLRGMPHGIVVSGAAG